MYTLKIHQRGEIGKSEGVDMQSEKSRVKEFWNAASCGERQFLSSDTTDAYEAQALERYRLEPYISGFARFDECNGRRVLEVGVGLGADHERFAKAGADLFGIDLTERAISHVRKRFAQAGLKSNLQVADAECLPFEDDSFDVVYSWGVIHHSPDTALAVAEIHRVLRSGGSARVMIYNYWSIVGWMLWVRYGLMKLRPWMSLAEAYDRYLESPGTKAYTPKEARLLFRDFSEVSIRTVLTHGDLLESAAGQRHRGPLLTFARLVWPRWILRKVAPRSGLFMMIDATK